PLDREIRQERPLHGARIDLKRSLNLLRHLETGRMHSRLGCVQQRCRRYERTAQDERVPETAGEASRAAARRNDAANRLPALAQGSRSTCVTTGAARSVSMAAATRSRSPGGIAARRTR